MEAELNHEGASGSDTMNSDHVESPGLSLGSGVLAKSRLTLEREMKLIIRDGNKTTVTPLELEK